MDVTRRTGGGTMRQGPPRRPLATCFRAVGNELQAAVQCECRAVGGAASPWLDAGRVHWWLKGECRAGTQRDARMGPVARRRACLSGGWVCGARWAMCSCEAVCVGMAWVSRGENARRSRAVAAVVPPRPPRPRAGNPLCVCATQPAHFVGCAARETGLGAGWERRQPACAARAVPSASTSSCSPG